MYTYNHVKTVSTENFYWMLPTIGEEWVILFVTPEMLPEILKENPHCVFTGPIPKPKPKVDLKLGRGAFKMDSARPANKI